MKFVAIIQQRHENTRLPGKDLLPLGGKSMTRNILERVQRSHVDDVYVAYPPPDLDVNDLIARHLQVAHRLSATHIVRIPGDNPCVDPAYIDKAVDRYMEGRHIFYTNTTDFVHGYGMVDGIGCEIFSTARLELIDKLTQTEPHLREHPHLWFYLNLDYAPPPYHLSLDVDTIEDYELVKRIYDFYGHNHFTAAEAGAAAQGVFSMSDSNQFDMESKEPYAHISEGTKIVMPSAGVKHGETVNYDKPTRSDS